MREPRRGPEDLAVVPVATTCVGVGPIPAEVGSRPRWDVPDRGDCNEGAERDSGDDCTVVRPPHPRAAIPIRTTAPTRGATPGWRSMHRSPAPTWVGLRTRATTALSGSVTIRSCGLDLHYRAR